MIEKIAATYGLPLRYILTQPDLYSETREVVRRLTVDQRDDILTFCQLLSTDRQAGIKFVLAEDLLPAIISKTKS